MPQNEWTWQPEGLLEAEPCQSPTASLTPGDPGGASSPRPLLGSSKCLGPSGPESSRGSTALRPQLTQPHHFSNFIPPCSLHSSPGQLVFLRDSWFMPTPGPLHPPCPQPGTPSPRSQDHLSSQRLPPAKGLSVTTPEGKQSPVSPRASAQVGRVCPTSRPPAGACH